MLTFTLIGFEVLTVLNYGASFLGWFTIAALVVGLILLAVSTWRGDDIAFGETEVINRDPTPSPRTTSLGAESRSTSQILDLCLVHQAQLKYFHQILCERVNVHPDSLTPMADLIAEAVFDGRKIPQCIYEVDLASQVAPIVPVASEKREPQHA